MQKEIIGFESEIKEFNTSLNMSKYGKEGIKEKEGQLQKLINERQTKIDTYSKIIAEYKNYLSFLNGISSRQYNQFISQTEYK